MVNVIEPLVNFIEERHADDQYSSYPISKPRVDKLIGSQIMNFMMKLLKY